MAVRKQDDQHEHTFSSYVRIRDAVLKTYLGWWTIGRSGERGSGISMLPARYDDDDEDFLTTEWSVCITLWEYWAGTHFGCVDQYMDLVGCVLVPVAVGQGTPWLALSSPLGSNSLFRGIPTGPEAFLELPDMSGLQTHLKKALCHTCLVGGTNNKYWLSSSAGLGHTSVGCVGRYTDLVRCVLVPLAVSQGHLTWIPVSCYSCWACQGWHPWTLGDCPPQALTLLGEARFITWRLRCPFFGECHWGLRHFWSCWACLDYSPAPRPTEKKALCHTRLVSGTNDKYWLPPSSRTWQFRTDTTTCCTNTLFFLYMFCLFNTLVPPTFSSSVSSFWPLTGHNNLAMKDLWGLLRLKENSPKTLANRFL